MSPFYHNKFPEVLFMRKFEEWMIRHLLEEASEAGAVVRQQKEAGTGESAGLYLLPTP